MKNENMLKAIIVDDEQNSRETLHLMLERYCPQVEVVTMSDSYEAALEDINRYKPDMVFLDIQMPDGNGFKLLEQFKEIDFFVIFTTAYEEYAVKAFKYNAMDYLLKPIASDDLINAVEKVKKNLSTENFDVHNIKTILNEIKNQKKSKKIVLSTQEGMHIVDTENIIRCESDDYYTKFFFLDGTTMLISKTLKEHEELLSDSDFFRPHKSHLVNLKYVKSYIKTDGGSIIMNDGKEIPVSRRKREKILEILQQLK